jgi:hypothetical protein
MAYGTANVDNIQSSTANTPVVFKDGNGTQIGTLCRAWVNFNGTGIVAIRASFNVSSITDNGTGDYTVNFTTAMPDANYATVVTNGDDNTVNSTFRGSNALSSQTTPTTSAQRIAICAVSAGLRAAIDSSYVSVSIFR